MRFTLQTLLLSVMVVWTSMAAFGVGGLVLAAIILAAVANIRCSESMWRAAAVAFLILLCGCCLLFPAIQYSREPHRMLKCANDLRQIALAMSLYENDHGCFPPAYIADANGRPMHSWRVLILPYLGDDALYQAYDFSEPWDGPNNRKLAGQIPSMYQCWSAETFNGTSWVTNYMAVVGPATVWPGAKASKLSNIRDGAANTIIVVEVADSSIHWMEPRDLSFEEALCGINPPSGMGISSRHISGGDYFHHGTSVVNVALADGHVLRLPEGFPAEELETLLTIDPGDAVKTAYSAPLRLKWGNCFALAALVVSVILLLARPRRREPQGVQSAGTVPGKPGR